MKKALVKSLSTAVAAAFMLLGTSFLPTALASADSPQTANITVINNLVPTNDPGQFNLKVNDTIVAANVGNNGTSGLLTEPADTYTVSEIAGTNTSLSDYTSTVSCDLNGEADNEAGTSSVPIELAAGDNLICTFTNTRVTPLPAAKAITQTASPAVLGTSTVSSGPQLADTGSDALVNIISGISVIIIAAGVRYFGRKPLARAK